MADRKARTGIIACIVAALVIAASPAMAQKKPATAGTRDAGTSDPATGQPKGRDAAMIRQCRQGRRQGSQPRRMPRRRVDGRPGRSGLPEGRCSDPATGEPADRDSAADDPGRADKDADKDRIPSNARTPRRPAPTSIRTARRTTRPTPACPGASWLSCRIFSSTCSAGQSGCRLAATVPSRAAWRRTAEPMLGGSIVRLGRRRLRRRDPEFRNSARHLLRLRTRQLPPLSPQADRRSSRRARSAAPSFPTKCWSPSTAAPPTSRTSPPSFGLQIRSQRLSTLLGVTIVRFGIPDGTAGRYRAGAACRRPAGAGARAQPRLRPAAGRRDRELCVQAHLARFRCGQRHRCQRRRHRHRGRRRPIRHSPA